MFQTTIQRSVSAQGVGLHTGVQSKLRLVPAPADAGIVFRRSDLDFFRIEAHGSNVARVSYATSLMKQGVLLSTTEHLLAAIYSCGIDFWDRRFSIYNHASLTDAVEQLLLTKHATAGLALEAAVVVPPITEVS